MRQKGSIFYEAKVMRHGRGSVAIAIPLLVCAGFSPAPANDEYVLLDAVA